MPFFPQIIIFSFHLGGVRGAGFISSKLLKSTGRISNDLIHVTDWLPTLVNLAGGNVTTNQKLDGVDQWNTLQNKKPSPRNEILLNIDPLSWKNAALIVGDYKIIQEGKNNFKHFKFIVVHTKCNRLFKD